MARVSIEDCLNVMSNRFALVTVAADRTRQLMSGDDALIKTKNKQAVTALRELAAGIVSAQLPEESEAYAAYGDAAAEFVKESKGVEATPAQPEVAVEAPVETAPVEVAPVETAPVEAASAEAAPAEVAPVEAAPVEAAPVEAAPVEAAPVVEEKKEEPESKEAPIPKPIL